MFWAQAASAQSLTASRRVGAAIMVGDSVVATGWNDVPLVAGEEPDAARGIDTSEQRKRELAVSTVRRLSAKGWLNDDKMALVKDASRNDALVEDVMADLDDSPLTSVIEIQRAVHAEMWAIVDAARRGVALTGAVMYGNTWPCHLCWKHVFSVGIETMYYIDSYPKSQATRMYAKTSSKLQPYVGVAPRQFLRMFANRPLAKADRIGRIPQTRTAAARPLVEANDTVRYLKAEAVVIDYPIDEENPS